MVNIIAGLREHPQKTLVVLSRFWWLMGSGFGGGGGGGICWKMKICDKNILRENVLLVLKSCKTARNKGTDRLAVSCIFFYI